MSRSDRTRSDTPRRAVLYARVSTTRQAQHNGTAAQQEALMALARHRGWDVVDVVVDEAISGSKSDRPGLDRVWSLARAGKVDVVAVAAFDRWGRSMAHLVASLQELAALRVDFVSLREQVDTTTPAGKTLFYMSGAMAEFERDLIKDRVRQGLEAARRRGVRLGRPRADCTPEEAKLAYEEFGSVRKAAGELRVSHSTLHRRLQEARPAQRASGA